MEPIFDKSEFSLTMGEAKIYQHVSEGSKKKVHIHFCDTCGTKLFLSFERFTDVIGVYGGTFDDPNWYERNEENTKHIFLSVAQQGTIIPPGVNTFLEHASTNEGIPIEPQVFLEPTTIGSKNNPTLIV